MMNQNTKGVLVVSFGTSYAHTCKATIEAIEKDIAAAMPDCRVYRAWTSRMIIAKLLKRDGIRIHTISQALEQMKADGIRDVIVQPTHLLDGIENDRMKQEVYAYADAFDSVSVGDPLLKTQEDIRASLRILTDAFSPLAEDTALILMGHGTPHDAGSVYPLMNALLKDLGPKQAFMATVEGIPSLEDLLPDLKKTGAAHVILTPFMIVAGDHANNDMAGDDEDSWKSILQKEGYAVTPVLKGLGEYEAIRSILVKHAQNAR